MSFVVRMSILGTILVVFLCGLVWEYMFVLPGFNNAQKGLTALSEENISLTAKEAKTMVDVKQVISKKPSASKVTAPKKKQGADDKTMRAMFFLRQDTYKFFHAIPWKKPETITVVYKRPLQTEAEVELKPEEFEDGEWVFWSVHFNQVVPENFERDVSKDAVNPGDRPAAMGGGSRNLPTAASAEDIMGQRDADKDGKLVGDEIPISLKNRMKTIDTNKDEEVSLDELKAFMNSTSSGGKKAGPSKEEKKTPEKKEEAKAPEKKEESKKAPEKKEEVKAPEKKEAKAEPEKKEEAKKAPEKKEDSAKKEADKSQAKKDSKAEAKK